MKNFPGNPMLIHTIQDRLLCLKGNSILEIALHNAAQNGVRGAVALAVSCHQDNPEMMQELLGTALMNDILAYHSERVDESEPETGAFAD